jgi:hypothetical protein
MFTSSTSRQLGCALAAIALLVGARCALGQNKAADERLAQFKAAGPNAALTVFPAGLMGRPHRPVGEVIALILERAGMQNLEIDAPDFPPPEKADSDALAKAFAEFVRAKPVKTEYALFAEFLGSPEKGLSEIRAVIVNRAGEIVWRDTQTPSDADFKRIEPKEPMDCCVLVVERLRPVLGLADPNRDDAPEGKLAKRWTERSGVPDKAELDAIKERQPAFKKSASTSTLLVYPALAGDEVSKESAAHLTQLISGGKLVKAIAADAGPQLEIKGNPNEQKVLWEMARGVRSFVQKNRPDTDYVLFAHYLMGKNAAGQVVVGGVHFVVCNRAGEWVIVDYQNSHHDDFNAIKPESREDCDRLVEKRLQSYCR